MDRTQHLRDLLGDAIASNVDVERVLFALEPGDTATITLHRTMNGKVLVDGAILRDKRTYLKSGRWDDGAIPQNAAIRRMIDALLERYARKKSEESEESPDA